MGKKDPVTPEIYAQVVSRDAEYISRHTPRMIDRKNLKKKPLCLAPILDSSQSGVCSGGMTLDHVKSQPMMGKRAPSDAAHLVTLCENHHLWTGWATSHRPLLREYLREVTE